MTSQAYISTIAPISERLISNVAFKCNLHRYTEAFAHYRGGALHVESS
jgi:hypothetical protein